MITAAIFVSLLFVYALLSKRAAQTPITAPVLSSPALSSDGFLVFGDSDGQLHAVSTADGSELTGFPIRLTSRAIRSSPSIAADGTIYVGADDGRLYAVGLP